MFNLFFDLKQFARMCHDKIAADDEQKAENLHDNFLKLTTLARSTPDIQTDL